MKFSYALSGKKNDDIGYLIDRINRIIPDLNWHLKRYPTTHNTRRFKYRINADLAEINILIRIINDLNKLENLEDNKNA